MAGMSATRSSRKVYTSAFVVRAFVTALYCPARFCPARFCYCALLSARICLARFCRVTGGGELYIKFQLDKNG